MKKCEILKRIEAGELDLSEFDELTKQRLSLMLLQVFMDGYQEGNRDVIKIIREEFRK